MVRAPTDIPVVAGFYCREGRARPNPLVSPVYADPKGLPPTSHPGRRRRDIAQRRDPASREDSRKRADRGRYRGIWHEMWHVFQAFLLIVPESREAISRMGDAIRRAAGG